MSRKMIIALISEMLRETCTLGTLEKIRKSLDTGELSNVFSDSVDNAIEREKAREYQDAQLSE